MKSNKAKVLVLGTFHMSEHEDLYDSKRQDEIKELVSKIAKFNPTKIAVEMVAEESEFINEKYNQFQLGTYELGMNEIFQVGFRLGSKLQHERIYPIDWMGDADMSYGEVESWATKNQPELLNEIYKGLDFPELSEDVSLLEYYKTLNDHTIGDMLHRVHLNIARIGNVNDYVGVNWLSWWYKRNLILFSNLTRLIDSEEERIVFIVGVGHATIMTNFIEESDVCEVVHPLRYLS